ncbi:2-octaprenyl-6-methoxyphenyl hydroxylase [Spirabiliibacterium falconis]|uniref:2-octaprenyl-6-methoxyphenyl hydroxylase n=1 Tax=Spirabiliibacterium falconis TaxID=572023 RepID=UPI001AAD6E41|nr:2-octaprenyl-6-methoxyphenyl hydroxylase [Spirabiliibacterium falconis]MBE2894825.1 2-octaprenyl-6-methoxyphenyl hydroxylase [Spirabiliibacterium falconis]
MNPTRRYDVIIIGGAMSGATLALMLAQCGLHVAVAEKHLHHAHRTYGFDARCIALSHGSMQLLNTIGEPPHSLWQALRTHTTPIQHIHISDRGHSGIVNLQAKQLNLSALGAVVALEQIGSVLMQFIQQNSNIDYIAPATISAIDYMPKGVNVALDGDLQLHTQLLVAADGTHSYTARSAGIALETLTDYHQSAVIANVKTELPHHNYAYERFTANGPVALLPMAENIMSLVWCERPERTQQLMECCEPDFLRQLQHAFGWRLGKFKHVSQRHCYPLTLQKAQQVSAQRLVLVGNAAQTLHPIAGQGFNLGLRDIAQLAKTLQRAKTQGRDIGESAVLAEYTQARSADKTRIMTLTDGLLSIFANDLPPFAIMRNLGLGWLACNRTLRHTFIKPTLGWTS